MSFFVFIGIGTGVASQEAVTVRHSLAGRAFIERPFENGFYEVM